MWAWVVCFKCTVLKPNASRTGSAWKEVVSAYVFAGSRSGLPDNALVCARLQVIFSSTI